MYKVSYRKYRPMKFADVVGQPQVTVTLKNELKSGRISHAYLFTGTRGTGKTTCAKILAKAVNCLDLHDGDPCGECEVCKGLDDGTILDVVEIDAASNNGVESIRTLIEESNFTPAKAKYRVYIIDEVHMLSVQAFNALLKTLEEPPPHVIFILATTEVHKLLPTILSRCQRFDFKHISPEEIAGRVEYVVGEEGANIEHDASMLIARLADGALRDALSILDQCLGRSDNITLDVVNEAVGVAGREYFSEFADAVINRDIGKAIGRIDMLHKASKDMARLCEELAEYFRGLMLIKTMRKTDGLVIASESELELMTAQALSMNLSDIVHSLDMMETTLNSMRYSNPRVMLEMAFVRLCSPELDTTNEALIRRIEAIEKGGVRPAVQRQLAQPDPAQEVKPPVVSKAESEPVSKPYTQLPPETEEIKEEVKTENSVGTEGFEIEETLEAPEKEPELPGQTAFEAVVPPKPVNAAVDIEELSRNSTQFMQWGEILDIMKGYSASVAAAFSGSSAYINGNYMLIKAPQIAFDLLKVPSQRDRMRDVVKQVTGQTYKLGPYKELSEAGKKDPLDVLEERAIKAGIPIEIKLNENTEEETI